MNTWGKSCSLAVCKQTVGRTEHVSQVGRKGELPRHLFYIMYGFSFTGYVWISFRHCLRIKPWFSSRKDLHTRRGLKCALGYDSLIAWSELVWSTGVVKKISFKLTSVSESTKHKTSEAVFSTPKLWLDWNYTATLAQCENTFCMASSTITL